MEKHDSTAKAVSSPPETPHRTDTASSKNPNEVMNQADSPRHRCDEPNFLQSMEAVKSVEGNEKTVEDRSLEDVVISGQKEKCHVEPLASPWHGSSPPPDSSDVKSSIPSELDHLKSRITNLGGELKSLRDGIHGRPSRDVKSVETAAAIGLNPPMSDVMNHFNSSQGPLSHLHRGYTEKLLSRRTICKFHADGECTQGQRCSFSHKPADYAATYLVVKDKYKTRKRFRTFEWPCLPYLVRGRCSHEPRSLYCHDPRNILAICERFFITHTAATPLSTHLELLRRPKPSLLSQIKEPSNAEEQYQTNSNGKREHDPVAGKDAKRRKAKHVRSSWYKIDLRKGSAGSSAGISAARTN